MIAEELLHTAKKLCGFSVTELFSSNQLLQLALCGCGGSLDELSLERVVWTVLRGSDKEVPDFAGDFRGEGGNNILKPRLL